MRYQVRFVSEDSLPEGVTWAFARQGETTSLFVKQSAIDVKSGRCDALTSAWEVWQAAEARAIARSLERLAAFAAG